MKFKLKGFTLIELIIVVAIVAILASIAIPSYMDYMQRSRRQDAMTVLNRIYLEQSRFFADTGAYTNTLTDLGFSNASVDSDNGYYTITIANGTANTFSATATPKTGTSQASDGCGTFSITESWPDDLTSAQRSCWNLG